MAMIWEKFSKMMDEMPNMYTEIGAVIAELGRQPRAAKAFLTKYQTGSFEKTVGCRRVCYVFSCA